jgi:glycine cleavage system H lipoate-binding protein
MIKYVSPDGMLSMTPLDSPNTFGVSLTDKAKEDIGVVWNFHVKIRNNHKIAKGTALFCIEGSRGMKTFRTPVEGSVFFMETDEKSVEENVFAHVMGTFVDGVVPHEV